MSLVCCSISFTSFSDTIFEALTLLRPPPRDKVGRIETAFLTLPPSSLPPSFPFEHVSKEGKSEIRDSTRMGQNGSSPLRLPWLPPGSAKKNLAREERRAKKGIGALNAKFPLFSAVANQRAEMRGEGSPVCTNLIGKEEDNFLFLERFGKRGENGYLAGANFDTAQHVLLPYFPPPPGSGGTG